MTLDQIVTNLPQFGIAGLALFLMWKLIEANEKRQEKRDAAFGLEREKHLTMLNESHKEFGLFQEKVRTEIMTQLQKNTSAFERVLEHFSKHT